MKNKKKRLTKKVVVYGFLMLNRIHTYIHTYILVYINTHYSVFD
jgi:hypothetical protein